MPSKKANNIFKRSPCVIHTLYVYLSLQAQVSILIDMLIFRCLCCIHINHRIYKFFFFFKYYEQTDWLTQPPYIYSENYISKYVNKKFENQKPR